MRVVVVPLPRAPRSSVAVESVELGSSALREPGDVSALAASIAGSGLRFPVVVTRDGASVVLVSGLRRLAALRLLGRSSVDVVDRRDLASEDDLLAALLSPGPRLLDPIEEALAFRRAQQRDGWTQERIAREVAKSSFYVSARMTLLDLPEHEREAVRAGHVSIREGLAEVRRIRGGVGEAGTRGHSRGWWFGSRHALADRAAASCASAGHARGRAVSGGVACGECWELAVREDERARSAVPATA